MLEVESWVTLNFFTSFLLVLLLIFQNKSSKLQNGRKYSAILTCTLILLASESIGRIGETYPEELLFLARIGYFMIFLLDPVDILFAVYYMDCWMDEGNKYSRNVFRIAFELFAISNILLVTFSVLFNTRWFFYFEDNIYYRGQYFYLRAIMLMIFICLLVVYAVMFRDNFMSEYKKTVLFLPVFSFVGSVLQVFLANLDTTYAGISLGCLIVFFFFQSKDVNVDYLTGVLNRRGLDIKLKDMVKNSSASGRDFMAVMIDIDNFKDINDSLGHDEGDKAIKLVADLLVDIFGADANIGRFGGDEFCVAVDNLSEYEMSKRIDQLHAALAKTAKKHGWPKGVDVSCGSKEYFHGSGVSAEDFQQNLDKLMYMEKQKHHEKNIM